MAVSYIPKGHHTVTPVLVCKGAAKVIQFLEGAFDATVVGRMDAPGGKVAHAEVKIGDSLVMLGDEMGPHPAVAIDLYLYFPDVDTIYKKAVAAGGTSVTPPTNQFWGDRMAVVTDPSGNRWSIATHVEDLTDEQITRRMEEMMAGAKG